MFGLKGTLARRWYQNADLVAGYEERVNESGISVGIDVAPLPAVSLVTTQKSL